MIALKNPKNVRMYKKSCGSWDVKDGDILLGYVAPVVASLNRPTGAWCYCAEVDKKVCWRAGHSMREAATRLIKKLGYEI